MMQQPIDIDEEKANLWTRVYVDLRDRLALQQTPVECAGLSNLVTALSIDDDNIVVTNCHGIIKLIEEYDDDVLFEIYNCILPMITDTSPKDCREITR